MASDARVALESIFPEIGPWTAAALWHGVQDPPAPVPQVSIGAELDVICDQRLAGLMLRYLRDSAAVIDKAHRVRLQQAAFQWSATTMTAVHASAPALQVLDADGLTPVVSKGPGIARFYPAPECRPYSDLDLLLTPAGFAQAEKLLEQRGWAEEERNLQPWQFFRRWCREGLNLREPRGGSVDLHHRIPPWRWSSGIAPDEVAERAESVTVAGRTLRCLSATDNLLVVALHLVSDRNAPGRSLLVWRDLVELARRVSVAEAAAAARRAGLDGWLRAVLVALPRPMGTEELTDALAGSVRIPHSWRLRMLLSSRAEALGVVATQFLRLPLLNGVAFVGGMLLPSRAFLRTRYPAGRGMYRRWWRRSDDAQG